jgi:hypothetical protein
LGLDPVDFPLAMLSACRTILNKNTTDTYRLPQLIVEAVQHVNVKKIQGEYYNQPRPCVINEYHLI